MTSESTLKDTKDYFESNSFFGLEPSAVVFFEQHQLPCLTFEGKLILKTQGNLNYYYERNSKKRPPLISGHKTLELNFFFLFYESLCIRFTNAVSAN